MVARAGDLSSHQAAPPRDWSHLTQGLAGQSSCDYLGLGFGIYLRIGGGPGGWTDDRGKRRKRGVVSFYGSDSRRVHGRSLAPARQASLGAASRGECPSRGDLWL